MKYFLFSALLFLNFAVNAQIVENRIPFVFLNQYFTYEVLNSSKFDISGNVIDFDDLNIDSSKNSVIVNLTHFNQFRYPALTMQILDSNGKVLGKKEIKTDSNGTPEQNLKKFSFTQNAGSICLISSNTFTQLVICKKIDRMASESTPIEKKSFIKIDSQVVENKSTVVLKDNDNPIVLEAFLSHANTIKLITKKRLFYPTIIEKQVGALELKATFADIFEGTQGFKQNDWSAVIDINQAVLEVPKDSIVRLKQDIFFLNKNIQNTTVSYMAPVAAPVATPVVTPPPVVAKSEEIVKKVETQTIRTQVQKEEVYITPDHQYVLEPYFKFAAFKAEAQTLQATLVSDLGKGFQFEYRKRKSDNQELDINAFIYQLSISSDLNNSVINNASQLLYGASVGWKYYLTDTLGITPAFIFSQDLFFKNASGSTQIDIVSGLNKSLAVNPFWNFYSSKLSKAYLEAGAAYILPTDASGLSVKSGYNYSLGLTYQYRYPRGAILLNATTGKRSQDFDSFKFSENYLTMSAGYSLYF